MLRVVVARRLAKAAAMKGAGAEDDFWQKLIWQYGIISLLLSPLWWRAILHNIILIFCWSIYFCVGSCFSATIIFL